eukprot:symbB.v1.2.037433.t1/scaffold5527.1/size26149/2
MIGANEGGSKVDIVSVTSTMSACASCVQWQRVLDLFDIMVDPPQMVFSMAMSACSLAMAWAEALKIFQQSPGSEVLAFETLLRSVSFLDSI